MKIAVALTDQSFTRTKSMGIFNVSMGLTRGLMKHPEVTELHILGNDECAAAFSDCPPHVHLHLMNKPVPRRFERVWWDQFGLPATVRRIAPDWLLLPKGFPPLFPCLGKTKIACYIHDVGWEYYTNRPAHERRQAFPLHEYLYFKNLSLHAMRTADLVLTHTQFNCDRIRHYVPSACATRIGIGFDTPPHPQQESSCTDILTYASTFPHKRLERTIARLNAWLSQRSDHSNIRIHIVGSLPANYQLPNNNWVHHPRLPFPELCELMRQKCRMAVYMSDYESFGMPPVECLLNGLPCITSDLPGPRENIPAQYLVLNDDEPAFIHTANACYNGELPFCCPTFPTWAEVTNSCVKALKNA